MTDQKGQTRRLDHGAHATEEEKKGALSELSMSAIAAASLGSVASFMCASKLGIAGSLIGACLTSAVSTLTVQLSKPMIMSSVEKIQGLSGIFSSNTSEGKHAERLDVTQTLPQVAELERDETNTRLAPEALRNEVAERHAAIVRRRLIAVSAAAALAALLVYAVIVNVATEGKGIGPTPESIYTPTPIVQDQAATEQSNAQSNADTTTNGTTGTTGTVGATGATGTTGTTTSATTETSQTNKSDKSSTTDGKTSTTTDTSATDTGTQTETTATDSTSGKTSDQAANQSTSTNTPSATDTSTQGTTETQGAPAGTQTTVAPATETPAAK